MEKTYHVQGMTCVICKANVEKTLSNIDGVFSARVNLLENEVIINFDDSKVSENIFSKKLEEVGYKLVITTSNSISFEKIKLYISIASMIVLMIASYIYMRSSSLNFPIILIEIFLSTIIIFLNINIYKSGFISLIKLIPNMNSLVSISSLVSYLYSYYLILSGHLNSRLYFETAAMILVIVELGKYIENNTKSKATKVIRGLTTLIPMQANLLVNNDIEVIKIENLKKDDVVRINPGESVPIDGIVINGNSSIDESMITGESLPKEVKIDDEVIGSTINLLGTIDVKITKHSNMTVLSNIINLTKKSTMEKLPIERFADKVSKYFVFVVIGISIITFTIWMLLSKNIELSLNFALSALVVSCPCALGLATPVCIAVANGCAAKNGVLIKKPEVLEIIGKTKTVILDKTGTLTDNKLKIVKIKEFDKDFINVLSSIEKYSNHPISKTILEYFQKGDINFSSIELIEGLGIKAELNNDIYYAGNSKIINIDEKYLLYAKKNNYSYIGVSKNDKLLGIVYLSDVLKESSIKGVRELINRNIKPIMCTGDNYVAAKIMADKLNIKEFKAEVTPEDKNELVKIKKKDGIVMMVGDGVNDAIALTNADVSLTVSKASDIASATSDIILMKEDISSISFVYDLANKTMKVIKENMFWALLYNSILIPIACGVFYKTYGLTLNPVLSSIAMWLSSMFVLLNSLRINSIKKEENYE